jgi:hypothetical protein
MTDTLTRSHTWSPALSACAKLTASWLDNTDRKGLPFSIKEELSRWKTNLFFREESDKLSTRGELRYKDTTFGRKIYPAVVSYGLLAYQQV